jgi:hypothetical protein
MYLFIDFTKNSDIDWNKSISAIDVKASQKYELSINEIDAQLYAKIRFNQEEIVFIEKHVKAMSEGERDGNRVCFWKKIHAIPSIKLNSKPNNKTIFFKSLNKNELLD